MSTLLLTPTHFEKKLLEEVIPADLPELRLCGFGLVASAAVTMQYLKSGCFQRVVLVGIAGSLQPDLTVGAAYVAESVACHGIGVGEGADFQSADQLGWKQWSGDAAIGDVLPLNVPSECMHQSSALLLSCCAASADTVDAERRRQIYPQAGMEDMEGFGVATACRLCSLPLTIIRGISNVAGDRDHTRWMSRDALVSASQLMVEIHRQNEQA